MVILMTIPNLLTVRQFSQKHPAFPEGGLRHRIFYSESNGLSQSGALVRNGRRVLIDETKFFCWLTGKPNQPQQLEFDFSERPNSVISDGGTR